MYKRDTDPIVKFVNEPTALYAKKKVSLKSVFDDRYKMVELIEQGLPYSFFSRLKEVVSFTMSEWSTYLDISLKSLHRYQQENRQFKPIHSEKILELAEVITYGIEVFGTSEKLRLWLSTPSLALGHKRPMDLIKNSYGKELVIRELTAIEHGVFA